MKTLALSILCLVSVALADDFKTIKGKEYKNVTVSRVEPDGIVITFSGGIVKIPFTELSEEYQKRFGYNPEAAKEFAANVEQQQRDLYAQRRQKKANKLIFTSRTGF